MKSTLLILLACATTLVCRAEPPAIALTSGDNFTFAIGIYETTNGEFAAVLNWAIQQGKLSPPDSGLVNLDGQPLVNVGSQHSAIRYREGQFVVDARDGYPMDRHPVIEVSWLGARVFCNWLSEWHGLTTCYPPDLKPGVILGTDGYRLPTEEEWLMAAVGPAGKGKFAVQVDNPTTSEVNIFDHCKGIYANPLRFGSRPFTSPVGWYFERNGESALSAMGCCDMTGNVWEWCEDEVSSGQYAERGGGWGTDLAQARVKFRNHDRPGFYFADLGFRVARSLPVDTDAIVQTASPVE